MRAKWFFLLASVLTGFLCGYAVSTQRALQTAQTVYLKIEPVDPRALLSGDYMQLRYDFERWSQAGKDQPLLLQMEVSLPSGTEKTADQNTGAKNTQNQIQLQTVRIKTLRSRYRVPHQFYFQEGTGKKYENAAYAKAAVLPNGSILLLGLTDENFNLL